MSKRTFSETVEFFEMLAFRFETNAARTDDEHEAAKLRAKAEAYELAAFELTHNTLH